MSTLRDQMLEALQATVDDAERRTQATRVIDAVCAALESPDADEDIVAAAAVGALGDAVASGERAVEAAERCLDEAAP